MTDKIRVSDSQGRIIQPGTWSDEDTIEFFSRFGEYATEGKVPSPSEIKSLLNLKNGEKK